MVSILNNIQCGAVIARSIITKIPAKDTHIKARPLGIDSISDSYSALLIAVMYTISSYNGPRYNGTLLYKQAILQYRTQQSQSPL